MNAGGPPGRCPGLALSGPSARGGDLPRQRCAFTRTRWHPRALPWAGPCLSLRPEAATCRIKGALLRECGGIPGRCPGLGLLSLRPEVTTCRTKGALYASPGQRPGANEHKQHRPEGAIKDRVRRADGCDPLEAEIENRRQGGNRRGALQCEHQQRRAWSLCQIFNGEESYDRHLRDH